MNICIVTEEDYIDTDLIFLSGEKAVHLEKILKSKKGDHIKAGFLNGAMGSCEILEKKDNGYYLKPNFTMRPPKSPDIILIVALPRPKVARRVVYNATTLGVKTIYFINSLRVEKSYWQSPYISEEEVSRQIILGLEQCVDTIEPEIHMEKFFKPFVEDRLPLILSKRRGLLMHPYSDSGPVCKVDDPICLIIGPEGGFVEYENHKIMDAGAEPYSLGRRILRVETAVTVAVSTFIPLCKNI